MDGSRIVTPSRMCCSLRRTRRLHSAAASCERSLMPSNRPSSSNATAVTSRPSSRARRTSSVRYSSPVVGEGASDSIRRRSQAASNTYRPELISLLSSSSSLASLNSTIASTMPNSLRTTRPSWAGSAAMTVASAMAASSWRRASRMASRSVAEMSGTSPDRMRISVASSGMEFMAARTASPVPRGSSWRAKSARSANRLADGLDRRGVDDDGAGRVAPSAAAASSHASRT